MRNRFRGFLWAMMAAVLCAGGPAAHSQTSAAEVSARSKGKMLYLRGMWGADKMTFDVDGKPAKGYQAIPFTESGINVSSVKMKDGLLRIEGQRMAIQFNAEGTPKRVALEAQGYDGRIVIEIQSSPGADYGKALDAIFAPDLASLTPSLPYYWQGYAQEHFVPKTGEATKRPDNRETNADASITPPRILASVPPVYTGVARALMYSGAVQVYLWVAEDGTPSHLKIMKPAGLGLDESALAAVQKYKFAAAKRDGKPVKVDIYIDVKFEIN